MPGGSLQFRTEIPMSPARRACGDKTSPQASPPLLPGGSGVPAAAGDAPAPGAVTRARPLRSRGRWGSLGRGKGNPQEKPCAVRVACTHPRLRHGEVQRRDGTAGTG